MTHKICTISTFLSIMTSVIPMSTYSAVHSKNSRSYAEAYQQLNNIRDQAAYNQQIQVLATTNSQTADLPVKVADAELATKISRNDPTVISTNRLASCAMIYPNGVFEWNNPSSGSKANSGNQCVSVVELRTRDKTTGSEVVVATTTLAAGDVMLCNIDNFPPENYNQLQQFEVPADNPPTLEDVEQVMKQEQKQHAGLKIAANAILGGLAGNLIADKEAGSDSVIGFKSNSQKIGTLAGILTGAGLGAATTFSGKVAGDTIQSTAVNAAAGSIIGNIASMSSGDSILRIEQCGVRKCAVGRISKPESINFAERVVYINFDTGEARECKANEQKLKLSDCTGITLASYSIMNTNSLSELKKYLNEHPDTTGNYYSLQDDGTLKSDTGRITSSPDKKTWLQVTNAQKTAYTQAVLAELKASYKEPFTGETNVEHLKSNIENFYFRASDGSLGSKFDLTSFDIVDQDGNIKKAENVNDLLPYFTISQKTADDGEIIDLDNKARLKGTLIGAGSGAALGGWTGYQGARTEVEQRWVTAVQEYNDSLTKFYCATGTRFLASYNDMLEIPTIKEDD